MCISTRHLAHCSFSPPSLPLARSLSFFLSSSPLVVRPLSLFFWSVVLAPICSLFDPRPSLLLPLLCSIVPISCDRLHCFAPCPSAWLSTHHWVFLCLPNWRRASPFVVVLVLVPYIRTLLVVDLLIDFHIHIRTTRTLSVAQRDRIQ